jgi:hypothetical protein
MKIGNLTNGMNNRLLLDANIAQDWQIVRNVITNRKGDKTANIELRQNLDGSMSYAYDGNIKNIPKSVVKKIDDFFEKTFSIDKPLEATESESEANTKTNTKTAKEGNDETGN